MLMFQFIQEMVRSQPGIWNSGRIQGFNINKLNKVSNVLDVFLKSVERANFMDLLQVDERSCMILTVQKDLTFLHQEKLGMNVANFTNI